MSIQEQIRSFIREQQMRLHQEPTLDAGVVLERDVRPKSLAFVREAEAKQRQYRDDAAAYREHVGDDIRAAFDELVRFQGELAGEAKGRAAFMERQVTANRERADHGVASETAPRAFSIIPSASEAKAMAIGTDSAGGYVVSPQMAGWFADRIRAASVMLGSGLRVTPMATSEFKIPRLSASVTVGMIGEAATVPVDQPTLGLTTLYAKKIGAMVRCSREVLDDSQPSLREIITMDLAKSIAEKLDAQLLEGAAVGAELVGLRRANTIAGATLTTLGTGNGLAPTLTDFKAALLRLEADGVPLDRIRAFMHPRTWNTFAGLEDLNNRPLLQPVITEPWKRALYGVPVSVSPAISTTETVGGSSDCSWFALVDIEQLVVGIRQDIRVFADASLYRTTDEVAIGAFARYAGLGFLDPKGIELVTGVRA